MVRDLTLRSPGPLLHTYDSTLDDLVSTRPWLQRTPGGLIGAVLRLCPRLRSLHIIDSSLPLHHSLAQCIVTWTPQLQHLTVRSKHTDAASLAFIVRRLPQLRSLDVAGVQTCSCRGPEQADADALALAIALGSSQVARLVLTSCRSFNDGTIFGYLARHQRRNPGGHTWDEDDDDDDDKNRITLDSLELHRINLVRPQALVEFLSSPACAQLRHLYIGGLRRLRSVHLSAFLERRNPTRDLDLEVDARLMSRKMYCEDQCAASAGLTRLRLFGPSREQGVWIREALREDAGSKLGRLREVIVIPREGDDGQMWKNYKAKGLDIRLGDDTSERVHQERRWCRQERARLVREQQQKLALIQVGGGAFAAYRNEDW